MSLVRSTGASIFTRKIRAGRDLAHDLQAYADELKERLQTYPEQQLDKPAHHGELQIGRGRWKSMKQRIYVLSAIRRGIITVPRQRTFKLRDAWEVSPLSTVRGSYSISVTNATPYAAIVQGTRIHQPATQDMRERQWRNWEAVAIGLLRKYHGRMRARIKSA